MDIRIIIARRPCKLLPGTCRPITPAEADFHPSYRFNIADDGTFENRKVFAHVTTGVPDGKSLSPSPSPLSASPPFP